MTRGLWTMVAAVALSACTGTPPDPVSTVPGVPEATTSTTLAGDPTELPTLALYLALIEQGLEGTSLAGAAFQEPVALADTGVLFCGLLDAGVAPVDVLRGWMASLGAGGETPGEDELHLGGVVLGAAVRVICPHHLDLLEL